MRARDNPFRTAAVLNLPYIMPAGTDFETLTRQFKDMDHQAALIAPKGHGKTTLTDGFCDHLSQSGENVSRIVLNESNAASAKQVCDSFFKSTNTDSIIVLDGAEQLGRLAWNRFKRRAKRFQGVLITTHQPGRLPELLRCRTNVSLLTTIVGQLAPEQFSELRDQLDPLFHKHAGDIRLCLRELYDRCST